MILLIPEAGGLFLFCFSDPGVMLEPAGNCWATGEQSELLVVL